MRKIWACGNSFGPADSQGAAKAVYYQAQRQDLRLQGLVLASPDLHGHWQPGLVVQAQGLIDAGKGDELLPSIMGTYWYRLSARTSLAARTFFSYLYFGQGQALYFCGALSDPGYFGTAGDVGGETEAADHQAKCGQRSTEGQTANSRC